MENYSDIDYSDDEDEKNYLDPEIIKEIKENDDFYDFLDVYSKAQLYWNFIFLKNIPAFEVFNLIKNYTMDIKYFNPVIYKYDEEGDKYWCKSLIIMADPNIEKLTDGMIFNFYLNLKILNNLKNKRKNKIWKVIKF